MRTKFFLLRIVPSFVIFVLFVFIFQNDLLYSYDDQTYDDPIDQFEWNSTQSSGFVGEESLNSIYEALDRINSMLWNRAYSESQVNQTILYESLPLTTANLDQQGHLCKSANGSIFVGLISKPDSFEQRNLIRNTLGKQVNQSNEKMLFFIGKSKNTTVNRLVDEEFAAKQDIVRLEFIENYYNLTLKTLSFLEYFTAYCDHFKFAFKLDEDVFVNWPGIHEFLLEQVAEERPTIYCKVQIKNRVIRDSSNKWYMNREQFAEQVYPNYCGGLSYILNRKAVRRVLEQHEKVKKKSILYLEDVYSTGICTLQTEIRLVPETKWLNKNHRNYFLAGYLNHTILAMHSIVGSEYADLFQEAQSRYNFR